jgi:multiple sugar transport system substrate-binding protein
VDSRRIARRDVLRAAGGLAAAWGVIGLNVVEGQAGPAEPIRFKIFNYQVDTVKEFLAAFEAENPGTKVDLEVIPGAQYAAKVQLMQSSRTEFDALYVFDHILSQWATWLEPLDNYPGADVLKKNMLPVALQSMTYKGKLYGLPYYTSYFGILYNDRMLKSAGFEGPPKTYDEWTRQARAIKKNGLSKAPMIWPVKWAGWGGMWVINAMVASRGGKVLDESLNVTPVALDSLKWWAGTYKEGLSDPNGIELDPNESARAFMSGDYATMLTANFYAGAQWTNDKQNSKIAGYAKFGPTPESHKTVGFARLYGINSASSRKQDAWRLVKFLGGTDAKGNYVTPKQWVLKGALTWGYRGVEKDPEVATSLRSWGGNPTLIASNLDNAIHMSGVIPFQALWYAEWELYAIGVLQTVLSGRTSPEDGAQAWTKKARELAARYK